MGGGKEGGGKQILGAEQCPRGAEDVCIYGNGDKARASERNCMTGIKHLAIFLALASAIALVRPRANEPAERYAVA